MFSISPAELDDVEGIATLVAEMVVHYGAKNIAPATSQVATVREVLFEDNLGTYTLVARSQSTIVGLASYAFIWPASGGGRAIYLKDLYVTASHRGQGIGTQLMEALKDLGRQRNCARIDWLVDNANSDAFRFYQRAGGFKSDKAGYRLML